MKVPSFTLPRAARESAAALPFLASLAPKPIGDLFLLARHSLLNTYQIINLILFFGLYF